MSLRRMLARLIYPEIFQAVQDLRAAFDVYRETIIATERSRDAKGRFVKRARPVGDNWDAMP